MLVESGETAAGPGHGADRFTRPVEARVAVMALCLFRRLTAVGACRLQFWFDYSYGAIRIS
jgi:hypothetical protein